MKLFSSLLDLIFPPRCEACRSLGPEAFCADCAQNITYLTPSAFSHSVGEYAGPLKKAIHRFKFKKKTHLADPLGVLMVKYLSRNLDINLIDLVVPVPLHEKRMKERGFNQAELLSLVLTKYYDVPTVAGTLFRVKHTHPQFDLPRAERFKNIRGAFEVKGGQILQDKNILLVDDILTTGSTVGECTRVLKSAGARAVHILTLSRAVV
jgi:ComF family protein